ncbi:MAG: hypothetical protein WBQ29_20685 [Isosphaeraceae bacterium]
MIRDVATLSRFPPSPMSPWPGTAIAAGEPIMTMFTKGEDVRECEARLDELETLWQNSLKA